MLLKAVHDNDEITKNAIRKLQMRRDSGEISEELYEEQFEFVMDSFRLKFAIIMDGRSLEAYNTYKNDTPRNT
jgi:hypothetical protein